MIQDPLRTGRTLLFVPGDMPDRFDKALHSGADGVVVDLEDAVLPGARPAARDRLGEWITRLEPAQRQRVLVRINGVDSPDHADDVACLRALPGVACLFPKFGDKVTVAAVETLRPMPVMGLVETAAGLLDVVQARTMPERVLRLAFGAGDFASDLGVEWTADNPALLQARCEIAWASRRLGLPGPVDTAFPWITDEAGLLIDSARAKSCGYTGKFCIHPSQVGPVADSLRPSAKERAWAERVLAAWEAQGPTGSGALRLDDTLVDEAVVKRAVAIRDDLPTGSEKS